MSNMKNWMMEIEYFCNECWGASPTDCITGEDTTADDIVKQVGAYFKSNEASKYAKQYLTTQMGEM